MKPTAQVSGNEMQILCGILKNKNNIQQRGTQNNVLTMSYKNPTLKKESNN